MRIIDLSLPISKAMPGVDISVARQLDRDGWNATTLSLYSHCGTHMDAPRHFLPDGQPLDQQSLSPGVGPALIINLAPAEPRQLITVDHMAAYEDQIQAGSRLLIRSPAPSPAVTL